MLVEARGTGVPSGAATTGVPGGEVRRDEPIRPWEGQVDGRRQGMEPHARRRRGRPPKYGRPARLVAVTLPNDVVDWLGSVDPDVGRAIVRLHDMMARRTQRQAHPAVPTAELVDVGEGHGLIVVEPGMVQHLAGVAAIHFSDGRAFLALESSWTMADLELSVVDALDRGIQDAKRRAGLTEFRDLLRVWRTDRSMTLEPRTIIVAGRSPKRRLSGVPRTS